MITSMIVVGALALGACGGDDDDTTANDQSTESTATTQASNESSVAAGDDMALVRDDFDGVPLPEGAEPGDDTIERDDFVVESYVVDGPSPEDVLGFYLDQLGDAGYEPVYEPRDAGGGVWRGLWTIGEAQQLIVSAKDVDAGTEITLSLRDTPPTGG
jgi:hypothetical protein